MMSNTMLAPNGATMSEAELFRRFLDPPVRNSRVSTLLPDHETAETMEEHFSGYLMGNSSCCEEIVDLIFDVLDGNDAVTEELLLLASDFASFASGVELLLREFDALKEATRTQPPEDAEGDQAYDEWERHPRYVLPVLAEMGEAA